MEKGVEKSYYVQNFGVFLIVFSYFNVFTNIFALGLVLAVSGLLYRHFKYQQPLFEIQQMDVPWSTIAIMLLFCLTGYLAALFALDVAVSKKVAVDLFNYMRAFFLLLIFANKNNSFLPAIWAGVLVGAIGLCFGGDNAFKQYFVLQQRRPDGLFNNPNVLAAHLLLIIPALIAGIFDERLHKMIKPVAAVTLIIALVTLIITESRGAAIALAITGSAAIFYYIRDIKKAFVVMFISAILGTALVAFLAPENIDRFGKVFQYQKLEAYNERERVYLWESAARMFKDHPLAGIGLGGFNAAYNSGYMMPQATEKYLVHPHNMIMYSLSETGIIGTTGLLALIGWQLVVSFKNRYKNTRNPYTDMFFFTIILLLIHGMVDCMFHVGSFARIYWILWALTCLTMINIKKKI